MASHLPCTRESIFPLLVDIPWDFMLGNCFWIRGASQNQLPARLCCICLVLPLSRALSPVSPLSLAQILKAIQITLSHWNQWKLEIKILSRSRDAVSKYFVPEYIKPKAVTVKPFSELLDWFIPTIPSSIDYLTSFPSHKCSSLYLWRTPEMHHWVFLFPVATPWFLQLTNFMSSWHKTT